MPRAVLLVFQPHHQHVQPFEVQRDLRIYYPIRAENVTYWANPRTNEKRAEPRLSQSPPCPSSARVAAVALCEYFLCRLDV